MCLTCFCAQNVIYEVIFVCEDVGICSTPFHMQKHIVVEKYNCM